MSGGTSRAESSAEPYQKSRGNQGRHAGVYLDRQRSGKKSIQHGPGDQAEDKEDAPGAVKAIPRSNGTVEDTRYTRDPAIERKQEYGGEANQHSAQETEDKIRLSHNILKSLSTAAQIIAAGLLPLSWHR